MRLGVAYYVLDTINASTYVNEYLHSLQYAFLYNDCNKLSRILMVGDVLARAMPRPSIKAMLQGRKANK